MSADCAKIELVCHGPVTESRLPATASTRPVLRAPEVTLVAADNVTFDAVAPPSETLPAEDIAT